MPTTDHCSPHSLPADDGPVALATETGLPEHDAPADLIRPVNYRFGLISVIVASALIGGISWLHGVQMARLSDTFLTQGQAAEAASEPAQAVVHLQQYLTFEPGDVEARIMLARNLEAKAVSARDYFAALRNYEMALVRNPNRADARRRCVDLWLAFSRYSDAQVHLRQLLVLERNDPQLWLQMAGCHESLGEYDEAIAVYRKVIQLAPHEFEAYARLARLLREQLEQPEDADQLLGGLVAAHRGQPGAHVVRAQYREQFGLPHAERDARIAWQLAPGDPEVVRLAARVAARQLDQGQSTDFPVHQIRARLEQHWEADRQDRASVEALIDLELADGHAHVAEQRVREALNTMDQFSLRVRLIDALLVQGKTAKARTELKQLPRSESSTPVVGLLWARLDILDDSWLAAIQRLDALPVDQIEDVRLRLQIWLHLGRCYSQIGHVHRALDAYHQAIATAPRQTEARWGLAGVLVRLGRFQEAVAVYEQLPPTGPVALAMARLAFWEQLRRPSEDRQWQGVRLAVERAAQAGADRDELLPLQSRLLWAEGRADEARRMLQNDIQARPQSAVAPLVLAELESSTGRIEKAAEILQSAMDRGIDQLAIELAKLNLKQPAAGDDASWLLDELGVNAPQQLQAYVLGQLAERQQTAGADPEKLREMWQQLAALQPHDLGLWQELLALALQQREVPTAQAALAEIERLEGGRGPYWKLGRADLCLMLARRGQTEKLAEARSLLTEFLETYPDSPQVVLRLAEIAERLEQPETAIQHYQAAVNRGVYHPLVVRRLVELLSSAGRYREAEQYLASCQEIHPQAFVARFGHLATEVLLRTEQLEQAVALARKAVALDSESYDNQFWLAQMLWMGGDRAGAEAALRRAIELDPTRAGARFTLTRFMAMNQRTSEIPSLLADIDEQLSPGQSLTLRGYTHELLGETDAAAEAYRQAATNPNAKPHQQLNYAAFLQRQQRGAEAEPILRGLLQAEVSPSTRRQARRLLAGILSLGPAYAALQEARKLLEQNLADDPQSAIDLRQKARLLAKRPIRDWRWEALLTLEQVEELGLLTAADQLLLVQLLLEQKQFDRAEAAIQALAVAPDGNPETLAYCIETTLNRSELEGATERWLEQLVEWQPNARPTRELQAQFAIHAGRIEEGLRYLDPTPEKPETSASPQETVPPKETVTAEQLATQQAGTARLLVRLADVQDEFGRVSAAARLLDDAERRLRVLAQTQPEKSAQLAAYLVDQFRFEEAAEICRQTATVADPEQLAEIAVEILKRSTASVTLADPLTLLAKLRERAPDSLRVRLAEAHATHLTEHYTEALQLYQSLLDDYPDLIVAMNELAYLLVVHEGRGRAAEALQLAERAIALAGPLHFLLDTRAVAWRAAGKPDRALADLEQALADTNTPTKLFHLAQVHRDRKDLPAARAAFERALNQGLSASKLHPAERAAFQSLADQLRE